jgi:SIR2-like domain
LTKPSNTVEDLITLLRLDGFARYVLFLGAGASVESGVPTASWIVQDLLRRSYTDHVRPADSDSVPESEIRNWAKNLPWYQTYSEESEYARVMRHVLLTPGMQEDYLRTVLGGKIPSLGYRYLGALVSNGIFQTIITTNFDNLVRSGCGRVLPAPITEMGAEEWLRAGEPLPGESRLLRLHGDFAHANLLNTRQQLESTPQRRYLAIKKLLKDHGLIVIGYGGNDVNLMREVFLKLWNDRALARHGVFWCHLAGETPSPLAQAFVSTGPADRAFFVEIQGFDETMQRLAGAVGCGLPLETDYRVQYKSLSDEYALLLDLVGTWGEMSLSKPEMRVEKLRKIINALRMEAALLLVHCGGGSFAVEGPAAPSTAQSPVFVSGVLQRELVRRTTYKGFAAQDPAGDDPLFKLFPPDYGIEVFAVWEGNELAGALAVGSRKTTVADSGLFPLVSAITQLLVRAAYVSRKNCAGEAAASGSVRSSKA